MQDWFEGLADQRYAAGILWTLAALLVLLVLLVIVKVVRSMIGGTFVAGGRNRKARLAVMDAAAVDSNRRLVLVRRDEVEHLLLIGGPTDVVVETDIRQGSQSRRAPPNEDVAPAPPRPMMQPLRPPAPAPQRAPAPPPQRQPVQQAPRPPERPAPMPTSPPPMPAAVARPPQREVPVNRPPAQPPQRPVQPAPQPAPQPPRPSPVATQQPRPAPQPPAPRNGPPALPPPREQDLDNELLQELQVSFEAPQPAPPRQGPPPAQRPQQRPPELSLDDEMTKLLGELSNQKR